MLSGDSTPANPYAPPKAEVEDLIGTTDQDSGEPYLLPCSPAKLLILSVCTFNIYLLYWFWKNFRYERRRNPEIWPVLRTIFSGIFFYSLARGALDEADSRGVPARYSPAILTAVLWAAAIGSRLLPEVMSPLIFLYALILMPVQLTVNRINRHINPALSRAEQFRVVEIVVAVPGGLFALLAIYALLFLPEV